MSDFNGTGWVTVYFGPDSIVIAAMALKVFGVGETGAVASSSLDEDDAAIGQLVLDTLGSNPREVDPEDIKVIKARWRDIGAMLGFPGKSVRAVADCALLSFSEDEVIATLWKASPRAGGALDTLKLGTPASSPEAIGSLIRQSHVRLANTQEMPRSRNR